MHFGRLKTIVHMFLFNRWLDYFLSRMAFHTKAFIQNSQQDRSNVSERMAFIKERLAKIERQERSVNKELQEYLAKETDNAVSVLSTYLKSSDVVEQFTSWTLDDVPKSDYIREVYTTNFIQKALMKRLMDVIAAWEDKNHVFVDACTSLIQHFQQRYNFVEGQLRNLEMAVLAGSDVSHGSFALAAGNLTLAKSVFVGVMCCTPNWVLRLLSSIRFRNVHYRPAKALALLVHKTLTEFQKDKCRFMANLSKIYLTEATEEQNLRSYVTEQLKQCQVCLKQIVTRLPELMETDKMLFQQLRDEKRSQQEIANLYKPLYQRSLQLRKRMAFFGIKEVCTMDISCSELEWNDDRSSLLGTGAFASVYRGKLKQREKWQPVALKVWKDELNDSNASVFLAETDMLR